MRSRAVDGREREACGEFEDQSSSRHLPAEHVAGHAVEDDATCGEQGGVTARGAGGREGEAQRIGLGLPRGENEGRGRVPLARRGRVG